MPAIKAIFRAKSEDRYIHFGPTGRVTLEIDKRHATVFSEEKMIHAYIKMLKRIHLRTDIPSYVIEKEIIGVPTPKEPKWLK